MKILTVGCAALALVALAGCGQIQRTQAHWLGHTKVCIDGVTYIQFPTGTVVQRDRQDHVVPCD